ncbi:phosphatidate cytidylyltransferase [Peristeroidobacter agariperforans]|uniref:phosphatidate cytidylyltransferase n=1 Tax=Peristeroidobacter agariperforans TaxID=268404 RepID=UPI00101D441C|nr:phosphatidate cytidylyltransferase [Peristeroidobacter agariperforans]
MALQEKMIWVFGGVIVLLTIASLAGAILGKGAHSESGRATVENLKARVNAWWVMIAVLAVTFALGETVTLVVFAFVSFFALREFITLTPTRPSDYLPLLLAFFVILPGQYLLIAHQNYGTFAIFIPVYGFLLLPAVATFAGDTHEFLERSAKLQWATMITVYCISYAPALLLLKIPGYEGSSALLLLYLLLIVQLSDVLQYVFGKLFGRTKLAPVVSPSKTVEGLVGGGVTTTLIGGLLHWITPFTFWQATAISFVIVAAGVLGGLTLSAMKRGLGAKDWGVMIEGHGGMLDRMDSVSFAAPVFFHVVRFFFT